MKKDHYSVWLLVIPLITATFLPSKVFAWSEAARTIGQLENSIGGIINILERMQENQPAQQPRQNQQDWDQSEDLNRNEIQYGQQEQEAPEQLTDNSILLSESRCLELVTFPVDKGMGLEQLDCEAIANRYFKKNLSGLTDNDFKSFSNDFISCKQGYSWFHPNYTDSNLKRQLIKVKIGMKKNRIKSAAGAPSQTKVASTQKTVPEKQPVQPQVTQKPSGQTQIAQLSESTGSAPTDKRCQKLVTFPIGSGDRIQYSNCEKISSQYFNKKLSELNDNDFNQFSDDMISCKQNYSWFQVNYTVGKIENQLSGIIAGLKNKQQKAVTSVSGQAKFDSMKAKVGQYEKMIDNNTFTDKDLKDMEAMVIEAGQLNKKYKYKYMSALSNIENRAENAIRDYKEKRTQLHGESLANNLRNEADPVIARINNGTATEADLTKADELIREANTLYRKYFTESLSEITIEIDSAIKQHENRIYQAKRKAETEKYQDDLKAKEKAKKDALNQKLLSEAKELLQKHGKLGPPEDFLLSRFESYGVQSSSGPMATVIRLHDILSGDRTWSQDPRSGAWILLQKVYIQSEQRYAVNKFMFTIIPETQGKLKKGTPWLEAIVFEDEPLPIKYITAWIMQNIPYSAK